MSTLTVLYDGTFEGFLTVLFEVHDKKGDVVICKTVNHIPGFFETAEHIVSDAKKSAVQLKRICQKLSCTSVNSFYCCYLSELPGIENTLMHYLEYVFNATTNVETDFGNKHVLRVAQVAKMVHREKHRMEAFIRFRLLNSQLFYAAIEPDFDVLPLINGHFTKRYADQRWLVYDLRRKYGLYYDLTETKTVQIDFDERINGFNGIQTIIADDEIAYENLWKVYFKNVNIPERKNMKMHLRHVPKRYWRYLPEKHPLV